MPPHRTFSELVREVPGLQRDRERLITEACRRAAGDDPVVWAMVEALQERFTGMGPAMALRLLAAIGVRMLQRDSRVDGAVDSRFRGNDKAG